jgi:hypothetical protein
VRPASLCRSNYLVLVCGFLCFAAVSVPTSAGFSQQSRFTNRKDEPSPHDILLHASNSDAGPTRIGQDLAPVRVQKYRIPCKGGDTTCDDLVGFGAMHMYERIRRCWQPPQGTIVMSSIRFGEVALGAARPDASKTIVSVGFELKTDGTLLDRPQSTTSNASRALVDDVMRAVERCHPYDMLPQSRYEQWKDVLLRFQIQRRDGADPGALLKQAP